MSVAQCRLNKLPLRSNFFFFILLPPPQLLRVQHYHIINSKPTAATASATAGVIVDARTIKTGFNTDTFRSNFNLFHLLRTGYFSLVPKLFDQMPHKNSVSTNLLLSSYAKSRNLSMAKQIFDEMPDRNAVTWTILIGAYSHNDQPKEAFNLYAQMHRSGEASPDHVTFATLLSCSITGKDVVQVHAHVFKFGLDTDVTVCNISRSCYGSTLVDMYAKCGSIRGAIQMFQEKPDRNIVPWNALISAHAQNGDGESTMLSFQQMVQSGLKPDSVTFLSILTACSYRGLVEKGLDFLKSMVDVYSFAPRKEHYASIIDFLCRSGQFTKAEHLINKMPFEPDEIIWSSVLNSCRIHRNHDLANKAAEHLFSMAKLRDSAAYITMSNIYASLGEWENVKKVKNP